MAIALFIMAFLSVVFIWTASICNRLIRLKNQAHNAWKQIDVQLKRRYDLSLNLVETVRGAMKFEQDTLKQAIEARNSAMAAQGVSEKAQKERLLAGVLKQLIILVDNYPDLKSNRNAARLKEELILTGTRLGQARKFYNDVATEFNIFQQEFPTNFLADLFGFKCYELFEISDSAERQSPEAV